MSGPVLCIECGKPIAPPRIERARASHSAPLYCSRGCAQKYNNRRLTRGAKLYDAFIAARTERTAAKAGDKAEAMRFAYRLLDEMIREDKDAGPHRARRPEVKRRVRIMRLGVDMTGQSAGRRPR